MSKDRREHDDDDERWRGRPISLPKLELSPALKQLLDMPESRRLSARSSSS
jgi:hypothetical protein